MKAITPTTKAFKKKITRAELIDTKAEAAIAQIDTDLETLNGSPTNADVIAILKRSLRRERKIINYLSNQD